MSDQSPAAFARPRSADPEEFHNREIYHAQEGMTLRDYFAAKAMQAAATNPIGADGFNFSQRATWAYQQADAMLKARGK